MVEIGFGDIAAIATAVATIALVLMLWKTIKQLEATVKLSRVQTEFRFRPWIGPLNEIKKVEHSVNDKVQFDVSIKNFGELPAKAVVGKFKMDTKMLKRDVLQSNGVETFNLGPILPNMEKHYWFFIEPELWKKATEGTEKLFTILYFEYEGSVGKSGYGTISEYSPSAGNFVHRDMWTDDEKSVF